MSNQYAKYDGYGPVSGRKALRVITRTSSTEPDSDPDDDYLATYTEGADLALIPALTDYLPEFDEQRQLFVVRHAPAGRDFLKIYLAGEWNGAVTAALAALNFSYMKNAQDFPLISHTSITLKDIKGWEACGPVIIDKKASLPGKLYSRVMFRSTDATQPETIVGTYWCWPYQAQTS